MQPDGGAETTAKPLAPSALVVPGVLLMVIAAVVLGDPNGPRAVGGVLLVLGLAMFLPAAIAHGVAWGHDLRGR